MIQRKRTRAVRNQWSRRAALAAAVLGPGVASLAEERCAPPTLPEPPPPSAKALAALPASRDDVVLDWPVAGTLNSPFGPRQLGSEGARYDWHRGLDIALPIGTDLLAPADAEVVHAGPHPGYADTIVQLRHNSASPFVYTLYLHLDSVQVTAGQLVDKGTPIAKSGQGSATYPHLHWEVRNGCLRQECCESPYSWLSYANTAPAAPVLEAFGDSGTLGRMVLLSATVPKTEIDFAELRLDWGGDIRTADIDELNSLTPTDAAELLDDPLFFFEEEGRELAILPKRFNSTFASADYQVLFWNLGASVSSGTATVRDGGGLSGDAPATIVAPPLTLTTTSPVRTVEPGAEVTMHFSITNNDTVAHTVSLEGISAQSLDLDMSTTGGTIAAGGTMEVTMTETLEGSWAVDVGDIVLLRATVTSGSYTSLLGAVLIDTAANAGVREWWVLR